MKYYAVFRASSKGDYTTSEEPLEAKTDAEAIDKARIIWLEKSESQRKAAEKDPEAYGEIYISLLRVSKVTGQIVVETKRRIWPA